MDKIKYSAPPFESVQHEVTVFGKDKEGKKYPKQTSLHSDVSLLMRIDRLTTDVTVLNQLKEQLQPLVDSADIAVQSVEDQVGEKLSDDDKIEACPSRYLNTTSEKLAYFKHLSESRDKLLEIQQKRKDELEKQKKDEEESKAFREKMSAYFGSN